MRALWPKAVAFSALRASSQSVAVASPAPGRTAQRRAAGDTVSPCSITAAPDATSRSVRVSPSFSSKAGR